MHSMTYRSSMKTKPESTPAVGQFRWRTRLIVFLLGVAGLLLCLRLVQLQGFRSEEFAKRVAGQSTRTDAVPARPGDLLDRHGRLFATTVTSCSLFAIPRNIADPGPVSMQLAEVLEMDAEALHKRLADHSQKQFLWIKRRLTPEQVERVRALSLPRNEFEFRDEYVRRYPQGSLAAQTIGLRDIDGVGQGGAEQSLDHLLRGKPGSRELVLDARGFVIDVHDGVGTPPRHGQTVVLTLDAVIQLYVERALDTLVETWKPKACSAVVLAPKTGEVLAIASRPTFDPNHPEDAPPDAWKNRAIADIYEPGSTFKPCVVAWGLQTGALKEDEVFHCENGEYRMGGRILHDHHPYGHLSIIGILAKSSNIGMAKIGQRMTNRKLFEATEVFGFGRRTGIELPGELTGVVRPLKLWNGYSTGSVPMGQEIAVTPIQMVTAYGALANGGKLITPHIVLKLGGESAMPRPQIVSEAVRPDVARWITQTALTEVVRHGTGNKVKLKGYTVFGKTGTSQKPDPQTGLYSTELHVNSFICGAPAEDPQVLVLITVDEPGVGSGNEHLGGTVAAPAAAEILRKTLTQLRVSPQTTPTRTAQQ